jgi:hypothetical protein
MRPLRLLAWSRTLLSVYYLMGPAYLCKGTVFQVMQSGARRCFYLTLARSRSRPRALPCSHLKPAVERAFACSKPLLQFSVVLSFTTRNHQKSGNARRLRLQIIIWYTNYGN